MNKRSPSMPIRHTGIPYVKFICFYKEETKMAKMTNNEYLKSYLSIMASVNDEDEKEDDEEDVVVKEAKKNKEKNGDKKYDSAVKSLGAMTSYLKRYNKTNDSKYVSNILEKLFPSNHNIYDQMFSTPEEFVLALAEVYNAPGGAVAIGYALRTLVTESKNILPIHAESYAKGVVTLVKVIGELVDHGVEKGFYEIDPEDAKIMNSGHKEAAMAMEETNEKDEKEVEKESASDKKKDKKETKKEDTDEKKKKEREAREAAREAAKQWIDFDEIKKMDCFKDDNKSFYKVANRIAKLFGQDDVKKDIDGKKFAMAYYANKYEFVIQSNDNLLLFWFKPGYEVTQYTNIDQFNADWAKAHASEQPKRLSA